MNNRKQANKKAILLAHFGTTFPSALSSLTNTKNKIQEQMPGIKIKISFTSNIIRGIWKERRKSRDEWKIAHGVADEVLDARSVLGAIGELQDDGYRTIIVQPTHIAHGEQYEDLSSYIKGLNAIKTVKKKWMPFEKIVISRPALGTHGVDHDYHRDMKDVVSVLAPDIEIARKEKAMLVYVGHGNEYFSTGIYIETQNEFRNLYPDIKTFIGQVEGYPGLDDLIHEIVSANIKKVVLKPFMLTAGDHAHNDIAGEKEDSWSSRLKQQGLDVINVMEGLGSNDGFANLYARRILETATDNGIDLLHGN
ncbi:MAG: sirohydrochlorin cobaltochelatase [Candidatus Anammoxibacter sp.]